MGDRERESGQAPVRDPSTASRHQPLNAKSPAAVDVVVGWQRSLGNAAVTRMLARQEESLAEPSGPGPTRIDREDPLIRTVQGPVLGEYGDYRWYVRFQLPLGAASDGWLIQELYQDSSALGPDGRNLGDHFWECWPVRSGAQYPADPSDVGGVEYDDRYVHGVVRGSPSGWHRHVGVIRFYPGRLPPEFGTDSGANFYLATTTPSGWTGQGTRHDAYAEWDYTGGHRRLNGFVAYAGQQELRRGDTVQFRPRTTGATGRQSSAEAGIPLFDPLAASD